MIDNDELFHHYALNVPLYTHFTSPIRRYADVNVHRLLAAALGMTSSDSDLVTVMPEENRFSAQIVLYPNLHHIYSLYYHW